jgi:hypothetical protein
MACIPASTRRMFNRSGIIMPHLLFEFMKIFSCWFTVLCFYTWDPATPCPATQVCTGLRGHWWSVGGLARLLTILLRKDIASSTKHLRQCECVQCLLKERPTDASAAKVRPIEQYLLIWKTLMIRHGTHVVAIELFRLQLRFGS